MNKLYNYFENLYKNKSISHAYLIGNTDLNIIKEELYKILSDFFFNKKIDDNFIDLYVLDYGIQNITKEEIKNLINNLSKTSQFNNKKVYIINQCENMNDTIYNALLKTLEEPQNNVYALLITKNIDKVKDTIYSRCQRVFIYNEIENENFDEDIIFDGEELIKKIEIDGYKTIAYNNNIYNKIDTREKLINILNYLEIKYSSIIIDKKGDDISQIIINNNNINEISQKIIIINNTISLLKNNLNKNLSIDRFLIEMWRCKNEDCRN